jgi:hypothetical protein
MALLPNYRDIVELLKKGSTIEAQEKIMELREGALSLQEENIKLREKIKELESKLNKKKEVVWESPYYWVVDDQSKDGPFCQQCYDRNEELIRLQGDGEGWWECKSCKNQFTDDSYSSEGSVYLQPKR